MADQVMNYKCPCCGAPLRYGGASGKLDCASCGNQFDIEAMQQAQSVEQATAEQPIQWAAPENGAWSAQEAEQLKTYSCPSCGAEIIVDDTTAATECVYCGNASIMPGAVSGSFRPDAVLPFKKTKQEAEDAYRGLIKGKKLLPRAFASKKHIDKITGVYVPFWLFQCETDANLSFKAQRSMTHTTPREIVTDTDHFLVLRGGRLSFEGVPVDGSSKFNETLMEAIEPFDYSAIQRFDTAYLSGYQAERYDIASEAAQPRANDRIRQSVVDAFSATVQGFNGVTLQSANVQLTHGQVLNVMVPVWMLNAQWQGKTHTFAMNGQTGKIVGDLPEDKAAAWKWRLGLFFGTFAGIALLRLVLALLGVM